jgi:vacuolar-type H+-ATPase subunit H
MSSETSTISAINHVLKAEADSKKDIANCSQQAIQIIENGRTRARRITNRGDERITRVHAMADQAIESRLSELRQQVASLSSDIVFDEKERAHLKQVVDALVDEMVGTAS